MKNIHVIPTDKPSRLYKHNELGFKLLAPISHQIGRYNGSNQYIYITSDEEITGFENYIWVYNNGRVWLWQNTMALRSDNKPRKIILTTDQDLIKDGVQSIDDEFLKWFVKNPSCEYVEVKLENCYASGALQPNLWQHKIIIPKEEQKQHLINMMKADEELGLYEEPKQETLEHTSKFIVFTLQDSEDWVQYSIALDSFEKADNFCQQFRDKKMSYLICQTLKQGYNGK